ncbi:MAG: hypothetical protein HY321_15165 [Armatimonadetes bacterium]|nr:hypothetical protein [Armatimonadota bacterium]
MMNRRDPRPGLPPQAGGAGRKPGDVVFYAILIAAVATDWLRDNYLLPVVPTFLVTVVISSTIGFGLRALRERLLAGRERRAPDPRWELAKLVSASVVVAASASFVLHQARQWPVLPTFAATLLAIGAAGYGLVRAKELSLKKLVAAGRPVESRVLGLTPEEARRQAEALLADPSRFECELGSPGPEARSLIAPLGPGLRSFLETRVRIRSAGAAVAVGSAFVRRSRALPEFVTIGCPGPEHTELAARPGEETVYVLVDDVPPDDRQEETFPTIYHCILYEEGLREALEQLWRQGGGRRGEG